VETTALAVPPERVAVPRIVVPLRSDTVPVGVPAAGATGFTVAVRVTDSPDTEVAGEMVNVAVVDACLMVCTRAVEVLAP
jgi:hypothetical protein